MQVGTIGLGRMGSNMARRLLRAGHGRVVYDTVPRSVQALEAVATVGAVSVDEFVARIRAHGTIWWNEP